MPISTKKTFKCTKCFYKEKRLIGDVFPDMNSFKPCPICKSPMKILEVEEDRGLIQEIFERLFKLK